MHLLDLTAASSALQRAYVRATDECDTELAGQIRDAQRQITIAVGMVVAREYQQRARFS